MLYVDEHVESLFHQKKKRILRKSQLNDYYDREITKKEAFKLFLEIYIQYKYRQTPQNVTKNREIISRSTYTGFFRDVFTKFAFYFGIFAGFFSRYLTKFARCFRVI